MDQTSRRFLETLLDAPGPSGFETGPARAWRAEAERFADQVSADVGGNSLATVNPTGTPRVMLAGHIDEIGLMVVHIDDEGYVHFDPIGGWDSQVFVGQRVVLLGRQGPVPGVIGKVAIHLQEKEDRDKVSKPSDLWIDVGALNRADAEARLRVGDAGVLASTVQELPNGRIVSRSLDNRIGAFIVLEALRLLAADRPAASVTAVATTQEEIAYATGGGARTTAVGLDAQVAVVVDVTHATDHPGSDKKRHGDVKLGGGVVLSRGSAVNPVVFDRLVAAAERESIPYVVQAAPRYTGTDADAIYTAQRGVATGLISVPNRYMHSPNEMAALEDLDRAARLLAAFARAVEPAADFVPR
jgi:putative aminopeptidase FrvX